VYGQMETAGEEPFLTLCLHRRAEVRVRDGGCSLARGSHFKGSPAQRA
jgi:hypothetical protein